MQVKVFSALLIIVLFFLLFSEISYSQVSDLNQVPLPYKDLKYFTSVAISDKELLFIYSNPSFDSLFSIRTFNLGNSWNAPNFITGLNPNLKNSFLLTSLITDTKRIIVVFKEVSEKITIIKSDNSGQSWSDRAEISGGNYSSLSQQEKDLVLTKSLNNQIYLCFRHSIENSLWFNKSTDNGETWFNTAKHIYTSMGGDVSDASIITTDNINLTAFFLESNRVKKIKSSDAGNAWSNPEIIFEDSLHLEKLRTILTSDNKLWMVYQKGNYIQYINPVLNNQPYYLTFNIFHKVSEDFGITWQTEKQLTKYSGDDNYLNLTYYKNDPLITFATQRFTNFYSPTFLIPNKFEEVKTPPYIIFSGGKAVDSLKDKFVYYVIAIDDESLQKININFNDNALSGNLFDDGLHHDLLAGDNIFANLFDVPQTDTYQYYLLEENNIKVPVDNRGIIANVVANTNLYGIVTCVDNQNNIIQLKEDFRIYNRNAGGKYEGVVFLFAGGFMMSGLDGNNVWANAVASAALVIDYIAGNVGADPADIKNALYVVKANDIPFGRSWQIWKDAVERGAEFYDGDNDGKYNPVDKNFNGIWDTDEDMPMILGDETVWCVYNDGVPSSLRRWPSSPKDIEIAQTIFTSETAGLENVIFLRYKIINKSSRDYNSVYFGFWADADLGNPVDDFTGCDTSLNSGFYYNDGNDSQYDYYGLTPPAFCTTLLQGPVIETNSVSDTAVLNLGEILGTKKIPNSKNLNINAHTIYISADTFFGDPYFPENTRNLLKGKHPFGSEINPCTFPYGQVFGGVDCNEIDSHFWFSGDPVNQTGWINTHPSDKTNILSTGPFTLKPNIPVDIIGAYIVESGTDALNSVSVTKQIVERVIQEYKNNFSSLTYKPGVPTNPVYNYELYQNYPNPFNPITTIRYALPQDGFVTLKIYDILGSEIATLVNEQKSAGKYEVNFNASSLSSGVYIYKIQSGSFTNSKKMLLLK